jgi:DNA-binding beta-propeller fold protein YncE
MRLVILFFFIQQLVLAQSSLLQAYTIQAREAYQDKHFGLFYSAISKAHEIHPYHQGIMYQKGIAAALTNRPQEAVVLLRRAILINAEFDLTIQDLQSLRGRSDFQSVLTLQESLNRPIITSDTAFVIGDRQLHVEGIASGPSGEFYLSSLHKRKVVRVAADGKTSDFTSSGQDGLGAVMSIRVDMKTNSLWVGSSSVTEMMEYDARVGSAVYNYDLQTGKLLGRYTPDHTASEFLFGDLVFDRNGKVFVSDTKNNTIFTVNPGTQKLELFFSSPEFLNIQGITFSDDGRYLFIADYIKGVFRLDMTSKELMMVQLATEVSMKGIDGLLFFNNSLVAIQNGVSPMRALQLFLDGDQAVITQVRVLDQAHPAFNEPTNGCIRNDTLYYIANSQWNGYDKKRQIKSHEELQDILILKATLKNK